MQGAIDFLVKIWNWFNGSKTKIGAALLAIAALIPAGTMVFGFDLQAALVWLGGVLTGVGLTHLAFKANTQPGPTA